MFRQSIRQQLIVVFYLRFNKQSLPKDQSVKLAILVSHTGQAVVAYVGKGAAGCVLPGSWLAYSRNNYTETVFF